MARLKFKKHEFNWEWCKGCGICIHFCPKKVLEVDRYRKEHKNFKIARHAFHVSERVGKVIYQLPHLFSQSHRKISNISFEKNSLTRRASMWPGRVILNTFLLEKCVNQRI